jgi:peptidyl-prolyl cis-trans isomerase D
VALDALRRGAARTFGLILVGLLVISFAIWGIADIFRGYGQQTLITVGDTEINTQDYLRTQQEVLRAMSQQAGRALSLQEARAAGLDARVLERLIGGAALDTHAKHLGLSISNDALLAQIMKDPNLQGPDGKFSPVAFQTALHNLGMSETSYLYSMREQNLRRQLLSTIGKVANSPKVLVDALTRFNEERRVLNYVLVPESAAGEIPAPTEEQLKEYYNNHKAKFTQPEYRKIGVLAVTPETVRDEVNITEADLRAAYEAKKDTLGTPERRHLQQIALPDMATAKATYEKIKSGTDFIEAAKEAGLSESDIDLGKVTRDEFADPAIAEEAFKLKKDVVSKPIAGKLGSYAIIRVTEIDPGKTPTFEEAKGDIEKEMLKDRASGAIFDMHDRIEDELAAGSTLSETADKLKLNYQVVDQVDRDGRKPDGSMVKLPAEKDLLNAAFATDVGVENDPIDERDEGVIWYEVLGVTPSQLKPFDQVRDEVEKDWRTEETRKKVAKFAQNLVNQLSSGSKTLEDVAKELNTDVVPTSPLRRTDVTVNVLQPAVEQAFTLPKGGFGSAASGVEEGRIVFEVADIVAPGKLREQVVKQLQARIGRLLSEDMVTEYFGALENRYGVSINRPALAKLVGTSEEP